MKKSLPVVLICALLLLWEACVRMLHIPLYVLPAPTQVIAALIGDVPTLARHAFISLAEALLGMDDYCMEYISAYREGLFGPVK